MTQKEFFDEYIKLYRFFYPKTDPDSTQISEYYTLLKYGSLKNFQDACLEIKQSEQNIPRNLVAYCKNLNGREDTKWELSRGANKAKNPREDPKCFACLDTGFLAFYGFIDHKNGNKSYKLRQVDDYGGFEFVKRCLCPAGQSMASDVWQATQKECAKSADQNGGHLTILQAAAVPF